MSGVDDERTVDNEVAKARTLTTHILELVSAFRISLKSYEVAAGHSETAEAHAGSTSDIAGKYGAVRVESGLPFRCAASLDDSAPNDNLTVVSYA